MKTLYVAALVVLLLVFAGGGRVLRRIDMQQAETRALAANQRLLAARLDLVRAELRLVAMRPQGVVDELARKRTQALRGALFALVRTGNASMVGDPTWEWIAWR